MAINGYTDLGSLGTSTTNKIVSNCCSTAKEAESIKLYKTTLIMVLLALAPWALLQHIRLFLTVAALAKQPMQLSFIKQQ